eukprot:3827169-Rhodomonas_salina.2
MHGKERTVCCGGRETRKWEDEREQGRRLLTCREAGLQQKEKTGRTEDNRAAARRALSNARSCPTLSGLASVL